MTLFSIKNYLCLQFYVKKATGFTPFEKPIFEYRPTLLCDFTVKKQKQNKQTNKQKNKKKFGKENLFLTNDRLGRNEM